MVIACLVGWVAEAQAATPASTLNDLCPGTPDPCIVTGNFIAGPGANFDVGGRALTVSGGAKIAATDAFSLTGAASIELLPGSVLTAPPGSAPEIFLTASGVCTLGGKILLNALPPDGGTGGQLAVECDGGVALGAKSLISAKGAQGNGGSVGIQGGGSFTSSAGAKIDVRGSGADGGSVDINNEGSCTLNKTLIRLEALPNRVAEGGGGGGTFHLGCNGVSVNAGTTVLANGSVLLGTSGPGGLIEIQGNTGAVTLAAGSRLEAKAKADAGGQLSLTSNAACSLGGTVDVSGVMQIFVEEGEAEIIGGEGGVAEIACAGVTVATKSKLTVSTSKLSSAGVIDIQSAADVAIAEKARLRFDGAPEDTTVNVAAEGACTVDGILSGAAKAAESPSILFTCSGFTLGEKGSLLTTALGEEAGTIAIDTTAQDIGVPGACTIAGDIEARGVSAMVDGENSGATGGTIEISCGLDATVASGGLLDASGAGTESSGGSVSIDTDANVTIDGELWANGKDDGGLNIVEACQINLSATGELRAKGASNGGSNGLTAHDSILVAGTLNAVLDGTNSISYLNTASVTGSISPAAPAVQDTLLSECVTPEEPDPDPDPTP